MHKVFGLKSLNSESTPVLLSDTEAGKTVRHRELLALKEAEEGGRLRHINRVHVVVAQAEDLRALEADNVAWETLLLSWQVAALDVQLILTGICKHVGDLEVPRDGCNTSFLEQELLGLDVIYEETTVLVDNGNLLPVS